MRFACPSQWDLAITKYISTYATDYPIVGLMNLVANVSPYVLVNTAVATDDAGWYSMSSDIEVLMGRM
jgi:hypothetical protein